MFIQRFPCEQFARAPLQHFSINFENSVCTIKHTHHDVTDGLIDACLSRFGHPAATLYQFRRIKKTRPLCLKSDVPQAFIHAEARNHVAGDVGGPREIV